MADDSKSWWKEPPADWAPVDPLSAKKLDWTDALMALGGRSIPRSAPKSSVPAVKPEGGRIDGWLPELKAEWEGIRDEGAKNIKMLPLKKAKSKEPFDEFINSQERAQIEKDIAHWQSEHDFYAHQLLDRRLSPQQRKEILEYLQHTKEGLEYSRSQLKQYPVEE